MKHLRLFFAAIAAMVGLSANAQLQDGTVYWIQDAATGQFISGGANWGTRAVVKDVGGLGFEATAISDGVYTLKNVMLNKVHNLNKGLGSDYFIDNGTPAQWTIVTSGEGYTISREGTYLCNNGDYSDLKVRRLGNTTDVSAATVWKFLTREEYDTAIQAYKDEKAAAIATSAGLEGVTSVASLEAVISDADQYISKNVTSSITNPTLASSWDGWTHGAAPGSNRSEGAGAGSGCVEFWNGVGYAKQTVSGLANGIYKVQFAGTYRPGNSDPAKNVGADNTSSPAFGYANDEKVELIHWIDEPTYANNRAAIKSGYDKGKYINTIYTYVSDGTLELGVVQDYWNNDNNYQWCPFGQFTLTYYTNQVTDEEVEALVATIPTVGLPSVIVDNLTTLKNTLESSKTIRDYNTLSTAITEAKTLIAPYAELVAENEKAVAFDIEPIEYQSGMTADDITAAVQSLKVSEYNYVTETYTTAIDLGEWTKQNAGDMTGQHWDGTSTSTYSEQAGALWNSSTAWTCSYTQDITLPAGEYVFKAAGRHSAASVLSLIVKAGDTELGSVSDFPIGDAGRGIDTSGATNFADGTYANNNNGRGWQWRYVPFTLDQETTITITVEGSNPTAVAYQWLSFCNYTVQAKPNVEASLAAYNQAVAAANVSKDKYPTVTIGGEYDALVEALAADKGETVETIDAATEAIKVATAAFAAAAPSYEAYMAEKAIAETIGLTVSETPSTADEAVAGVQTLKVDEASFVSEIYPADATVLVGDLSTWTGSEGTGTSNNQHWSGQTKAYYEQGGNNYGNDSWEISYVKAVSLPAGKYMAKVAARGSADLDFSKLTISASESEMPLNLKGGAGKGITTDGTASFDEGEFANTNGYGWEWEFLPFELTEETEVTFTLAAKSSLKNRWVSFCDFALLNVAATAEDYAALENAKPEDVVLGFEEGEYAPYNNIEAAAALELANEIDTEAQNAQVLVQQATAALLDAQWTANDEEVNAFFDGTFASAENNGAPAGWTMSNNTLGGDYHSRAFVGDDRMAEFNETKSGLFMRFDGTNSNRGSMYYYGNEAGYTMPLKANTTYYVKVDFAGWGSTGKPLRMNVTGPEGFNAVNQQITTSVQADNADNTPQQFFIVFTTADAGNYVINFQTPGADTNTHNVVISNCQLFKAKPETVTIKAGRQYTAFSSAMPLDFTDTGLKAEIVVSETGQTQEVTKVPANTGVIVGLAAPATELTEISVPVCVGETDDVTANKLVAVVESATVQQVDGDNINYVFGKKNGKEAFYKVVAAGMTVPAHNAYLAIPTAAGAKEVIFLGGETTGVSHVDADAVEGDIYTVSGVKVQKAQKGVYIMNGKKLIVK